MDLKWKLLGVPRDLISQLPDRQPSDRLYWTVRSAFTDVAKKYLSAAKT
jgi:hypothetical protein